MITVTAILMWIVTLFGGTLDCADLPPPARGACEAAEAGSEEEANEQTPKRQRPDTAFDHKIRISNGF